MTLGLLPPFVFPPRKRNLSLLNLKPIGADFKNEISSVLQGLVREREPLLEGNVILSRGSEAIVVSPLQRIAMLCALVVATRVDYEINWRRGKPIF